MAGTLHYPLVEQIRDTIAVHGLAWTVRYVAKRMPQAQARVFLIAAYC